jgi:hypothetical protein
LSGGSSRGIATGKTPSTWPRRAANGEASVRDQHESHALEVIEMKMKVPALIWLILSTIPAAWGCSSTADEMETTPPNGWQEVDSSCQFLFQAPSTLKRTSFGGVDSCVGEYGGPGIMLSYDYGGYSDPLETYSGSADYKEEMTIIDGAQAKVISLRHTDGRELPYSIAVHFADIGKDSIKLTMWINCAGTTEMETGRKIIDSISFP